MAHLHPVHGKCWVRGYVSRPVLNQVRDANGAQNHRGTSTAPQTKDYSIYFYLYNKKKSY